MAGYDPNQPRAPKGNHEGGQWTKVFYGALDYSHYKSILESNGWQLPMNHPDYAILDAVKHIEIESKLAYRMTPEEYVSYVESMFRHKLQVSDVYMRITEKDLVSAMEEGEFKNTFQSGKSKASLSRRNYEEYVEKRKAGEKMVMGIHESADESQRPIYGYFSSDHDNRFANEEVLGQYGPVAVKFKKDKIQEYVTFTDHDSLEAGSLLRSSKMTNPKIVSGIKFIGKREYIDNSENSPDTTWKYWEAQIFNRSTKNVQEVIFPSKPSKTTIEVLERQGIPWRIISL